MDVLDSDKKKKLFRQMRGWFLEAFPGENAYVKTMRKILKRKLFFPSEVFRLLVAMKDNKVIGGAVYRHWFDLDFSTLEYLFVSSKIRSQGIGTILYKKMREDLKRMKSKGLFFSIKGTKDMDKCIKKDGTLTYPKEEQISRKRREIFYRKLVYGF